MKQLTVSYVFGLILLGAVSTASDAIGAEFSMIESPSYVSATLHDSHGEISVLLEGRIVAGDARRFFDFIADIAGAGGRVRAGANIDLFLHSV